MTETPYLIRCIRGSCRRDTYLTSAEYRAQLLSADARWHCPACGAIADFDDDNFETSKNLLTVLL